MHDLMARLVDMEVDELGGTTGLEDAEAGGPAEAEPSAVETAAVEPPPWTPDPNEWQRIVDTNSRLEQLLAQAYQPGEEEQLPPLDPYDENFGETLEQRLQRLEERLVGAVSQTLAPIQNREAEQQLAAWFEEQKIPEQHREVVSVLANGFLPRDQYGQPSIQSGQEQQLLASTAKYLRDFIETERQAAVTEWIASQSGTPVDGGPAANGGGSRIVEAPKTYDEIIDRFTASRNLS